MIDIYVTGLYVAVVIVAIVGFIVVAVVAVVVSLFRWRKTTQSADNVLCTFAYTLHVHDCLCACDM